MVWKPPKFGERHKCTDSVNSINPKWEGYKENLPSHVLDKML